MPTAPQANTFAVVDAAGNEGASTPAFNVVFGYFACDPVRAALLATQPQFLATTNCTSCHTTTNATNPAPAGTLVAAPATQLPNNKPATYWCRRP